MKGVSLKVLISKVTGLLSNAFTTASASATVRVNANTNSAFTITPPTVSGYTPIAIRNVQNSHGADFCLTDFRVSGFVVLRNVSSTAANVTVTLTWLYAKSELVGGGTA